ncbi:Pre-mRNA-splicing factor clf1 like protein [Verticillium longisporum]|uniref:Pre-mRNA-splicing factor clf1 like protein n=1 Tax=Verticillium longisporum TaxID=100787 RepID=A0A8I3A4P5_VERLO|nr:Pre-mRNA-splicing factor clf1 like protein [Verticillium longisporum]
MESARGPPKVKNKAAAPIQISAEQLLREAVDRQEVALQAPTQRFSDLEELHEHQGRKRREFEDYVRRNRVQLNNWLRYADWEIQNKELARARSIFERALDVHPNSVSLWHRYIEAEMKTRNINHARNLLDRAVARLPRVDKMWYKYVYMEEMLGNVPGTRQVFDRWMQWHPDEAAWSAYIKLEKRYGEFDRARDVFRRFITVHPEPRNWIKWAKFEEEYGTSDMVREVFNMAIQELDEFADEKLFIAYARYEAKLKEYERSRLIYKIALDKLPRSRSMALHKAYTTFEKQFGDESGVEDVVLSKRRVHYENQVKENPKNYDIWFDYTRLEETSGDVDRIRDVYERAVAQVPPAQEKRFWRRYIYLWVYYALWEELEAKDIERARQIYKVCLDLIPHKKYTFAKIWLLKAQFEIRQGELTTARKTLGQAIGMCPKDKLFRGYIELELKLFEFNEEQPVSEEAKARARKVFERGHKGMRVQDLKEETVTLLNAWLSFEKAHGSAEDVEKVQKQMPRRVKKRRLLEDDTHEEYIDYVFPADDQQSESLSNLLAMAQAWKQQSGGDAA